jgi:hypothetical protein
MPFEIQYRKLAFQVPGEIRHNIISEGWIRSAVNVQEANTPMEFLFDVYMEYIDINGEWDDFTCHPCRQKVLEEWKKLEPYLKQLDYAC